MRRIEQPGPEAGPRVVAVPCYGKAFAMTLLAGESLLQAVEAGFAAAGFASGTLGLEGFALAPFAYVMPALSTTSGHAAFYSDVFRPTGTAHVAEGAMTFGERDGAAFFHAHALWQEEGGRRTGGHILPDETVVAEPVTLQAFGLSGARFRADQDPETNFKLFAPVPEDGAAAGSRCFALRVRPNVDLCSALEAFCFEQGIARARIRGGVGSTIGARFTDGSSVENFATEVAITAGEIAGGEASIDVALVDYTGALARGRLVRGDNPVLMTFELVLEAA